MKRLAPPLSSKRANGSQTQVPILSLSTLQAPCHLVHYRRKQHLYHVGDMAQSILRVRAGLVRITRMTPEGRVLTVRHIVPGDFFGEDAFEHAMRQEVAEALTDVSLESFDQAHMNQADLQTIIQSLARQMKRLLDYEYHLQTGDLRQRVARYLLMLARTPLADCDAQGKPVIAATHELIAEGTASTRESVSKIITELRSEALIDSGYRSIVLRAHDALQALASS